VGLDEVQVFGKPSENENLALKSNGTRVHTDTAFNQQGGRFPIERVIDGKFGTQRWQASFNKEKKQNPWLELTFAKPITGWKASIKYKPGILFGDRLYRAEK
jgi:hypothetical protein